MLDSDTKRRIDSCRDILVGKVPDPKSQVEQITIALIYKFMDDMDAEAEEFGGARKFFAAEFAKYGWPKLMALNMSGFDVLALYSEAIQKMNENPGVPPLFRDIFKNAYLPYRDPETLRSFLKEIDSFTYDHSERLGDAFEYLLSVLGSQGDAGQFRTPRHIIDFMVEALDPKKDETILDPACGTAGFLISSYKHILKHNSKDYRPQNDREAYDEKAVSLEDVTLDSPLHYKGDLLTPDDRKRLANNIRGYDISPDMVRLSLVNLYLHGFTDPRIIEYDTLTSEERWNEYTDIILANPPFMSPKGGIKPHKRFSVQATRSEVLFVDYIAEHLTPTGRAAIIVPEGIIFQSGTAYKQLREMLVKKYLVAVISLPAGVFNPYSGVKTSIIILDRRLSQKTDSILFAKIENDGFGLGAQRRSIDKNDLPAAVRNIKAWMNSVQSESHFDFENIANLYLVEKERIAENGEFNLSGESYKEDKSRSSHYQLVELGEVAKILNGYAFKSENYTEHGIRVIRITNVQKGAVVDDNPKFYPTDSSEPIDKFRLYDGDLLISLTGNVGRVGRMSQELLPAALNQRVACIRADNTKLNTGYLFSLLNLDSFEDECIKSSSGVAQKNLSTTWLDHYKIPLPPLDVQKEIVAEIESYQKIIGGARQVVENYQPRIHDEPDWPIVELASAIKLASGDFLSSSMKEDGVHNVYGGNGINGVHSKYNMEDPTLVIGRVGAYCGAIHITNPKSWVTDNALYVKELLMPIDIKYLAHTLTALKLNQYAKVGGQPSISQSTVLERKIRLPDIEMQKLVVSQIEQEQRLVDANKELIELFEAKVKATINRVWEEAK